MSTKRALNNLFARPLIFLIGGCFLSLSAAGMLLSMTESASAAPIDPITVSLDENGNATISPSGGPLSIPLIGLDTDPISGIQTLRYEVVSSSSSGPPVTQGDVEVCDDPACASISDVLRFVNNTTTQLFVFSDVEPGQSSEADVGIPPSLQPNVVQVVEVPGPDGSTGITYTPTSGEPGFFTEADMITYDFTSNAATSPVPEPSSWSIFATSLACLLGWGLIMRTRRARGSL